MIKSNELRVGNWIELEGHFGQFTQSDFYRDSFLKEINPIVFKQKLLIEFGFDVEKCSSYSTGKKVVFYVYRNKTLTYNSIQKNWWVGNLIIPNQPKYIHQIQNLFYSIEGVELERNTN